MSMTVVSSDSSLPVLVMLAVLLAAVLHASWNAIAHSITDRLIGFAIIGGASTLCGVAIVLAAPSPAQASWPFLGASAALHVAYNLLLMRGYRLGEFGQVYPLARGTSPWLVAIAATLFAGESLPAVRAAGIAIVSLGLAALVFAGGVPTRASFPAISAALLTGVAIAAYTTLDGLGVRQAGTVAGYTGWLFVAEGPALPAAALVARRSRLWRDVRPHLLAGVLGGLLSLGAYAIVLWAQTRGALAPIAALRETSVIVGAVIGAVLFKERFGGWRIAATTLVAAGVIIMNV